MMAPAIGPRDNYSGGGGGGAGRSSNIGKGSRRSLLGRSRSLAAGLRAGDDDDDNDVDNNYSNESSRKAHMDRLKGYSLTG